MSKPKSIPKKARIACFLLKPVPNILKKLNAPKRTAAKDMKGPKKPKQQDSIAPAPSVPSLKPKMTMIRNVNRTGKKDKNPSQNDVVPKLLFFSGLGILPP